MDPVSDLILTEAPPFTGRVAVLQDVEGYLVRNLVERGVDAVGYCDDLRAEQALPLENRSTSLEEAVGDASLVLWRLPRSLEELRDDAERIALTAPEHVRLVAGGRVKHMTRAMNDVLADCFGEVRASLGAQKSRVLHAARPLLVEATWPRRRTESGLGIIVLARGGVFSGNRLDPGTRLLLNSLALAESGQAIDLGCGSGIIATQLALGGWQVTGVDVSRAACESTRLTAQANGAPVEVLQSDGLTALPPASAELIVTNPPFHQGAAKDSTPTREMFADAPRVLRPGGELWTVFNSHLPYLAWQRELIGPTRIVAQDRHFTVTCATRRADR
ncbi:MAG: class I SAM-dependent methyltransferase [Micropruina sp.]|nr:methyltransferase [Micropruina sp.]